MTQTSEVSDGRKSAQDLRRLLALAALPLLALVAALGYLGYTLEFPPQLRNVALIVALACVALFVIAGLALGAARGLTPVRAEAANANHVAGLQGQDARYRAVVETSSDGFWVVDREGRLLDVNDTYARRSGYTRDELLGMRVSELDAREKPQEVSAHIAEVIRDGHAVFESLHRAKDGTLWPVEIVVTAHADRPGELLTFVRDIGERKRAESLLRTRLRMAELGQQGRKDELLQVALDAAEEITGSEIGFFHFVDPDQENLSLQAWSTNTLARMCTADGKGSHYAISAAGVWVDCFHTRAPVIHNDYAALAHKKGLPPGHAPVRRELVVPILRNGKVTEILGVGNKATDYVQADVEAVQIIAGMAQDLVERIRAEAALKASEEQQRALLAALPEGVVTLHEGSIKYANNAMLRMLGLTDADAMEGRKLYAFAPAARRDDLIEALGRAQQADAALLTQLTRSDGRLIDVELTLANLPQEPGTSIVVARDIGERLAADARIRRLTHLYAALSQCNQAVLHCQDEKLLFEQICTAIVEHGGMALAWIGRIDRKSKLLVPVALYGDDTGYLKSIQVSIDPGLAVGRGPGGTSVREKRPVWCQDFMTDPNTGPWKERARAAGWRSVAALPLSIGDEVVGALSIYSPDVAAFDQPAQVLVLEMAANISFALTHFARETERVRIEAALKESEGRLSAIFHAGPLGIIVTARPAGVVLEANDAVLRLFGRSRDAVLGRTVQDLGIYADPKQREALGRALRETGRLERCPMDVILAGGARGTIEISGQVVELQGRQCLVAMIVDVTERKRLEEMHLQAQKLESLGTLAGGIAHDFNNILAAIRGNADLAAQDVGAGHAASDSLEEIRIASMRAHDLVRRIMAFARPKEASDAVVDLAAVVDEVLKLLRSALRTSIELKTEFAPDTPRVRADAAQLHEAVVNLTTNAAYAIGARPGCIEYRLHPVQVDEKLAHSIVGLEPGLYARLSVRDDGCGMDAATLERIFDVFYTTKPVGEGTGLGLSMVHGTMRSHGGAIAVHSAPGQGSRFELYFPAASAAQEATPPPREAPAGLPASGKRVLYVDDEEALIMLAQRILTRMGHEVAAYSDAEDALAALRARPDAFDVMVTDLSMPHMSGFDLARAALALRPDLPVLMTTGYISAEDEGNARALGIREVVLKPVTMDELGRLLDRLLRETV